MKSDELRSIQAPLKEQYRNEPETAVVTLKASGKLGENVTCKVETGKAIIEAGLHKATGGDGLHICSGDLLLEALAACAGVTLNAVASAIGVDIKEGTVYAEGDLDFRGTLAVSKEAPVGFKNIKVNFKLNTDASEEQLTSLLKLTERYCVVYQTLCSSPEMSASINSM